MSLRVRARVARPIWARQEIWARPPIWGLGMAGEARAEPHDAGSVEADPRTGVAKQPARQLQLQKDDVQRGGREARLT